MGKVMLDQAGVAKAGESRSEANPGVTCVAFFHERRPWVFDALIGWFLESLRSRLFEWLRRDWIRLAPARQIHATLIGMEAHFDHVGLVSKNRRTSEPGVPARPMDLDGFAAYLQRMEFPIRLCFGGFSTAATSPYDIRPPFERSFTIRPDGLVVAIGWPVIDGVIRPALVDFRKGAENFDIIHKYHRNEMDQDNDLFLVLGVVTPMPWEGQGRPRAGHDAFIAAISDAQEGIRESLRAAPLDLELRREHCCVVRYRSADLAGVPERDILPWEAVTADRLRDLYRSS